MLTNKYIVSGAMFDVHTYTQRGLGNHTHTHKHTPHWHNERTNRSTGNTWEAWWTARCHSQNLKSKCHLNRRFSKISKRKDIQPPTITHLEKVHLIFKPNHTAFLLFPLSDLNNWLYFSQRVWFEMQNRNRREVGPCFHTIDFFYFVSACWMQFWDSQFASAQKTTHDL